jgi:putative flippase GtrA
MNRDELDNFLLVFHEFCTSALFLTFSWGTCVKYYENNIMYLVKNVLCIESTTLCNFVYFNTYFPFAFMPKLHI